MTDEVRFEDPPVREVALAILFEPMAAVSVLDLAAFRLELEPDYPHVEEVAPLAPWEGSDEGSVSFVAGHSKWPMPMCLLTNSTRDMQIGFQNDRLTLAWTYGLDVPTYPGFSVLFSEMERVYRIFLSSLHSTGNPLPIASRISVQYTNQIAGISATDLSSGLLHGWPIDDRTGDTGQWMTSLRLHRHDIEENDNVSLVVFIDPDIPDDPDSTDADSDSDEIYGHASIMRIGGEINIKQQEDTLPAITRAHKVILQRFTGFSSEEMMQRWRRIR